MGGDGGGGWEGATYVSKCILGIPQFTLKYSDLLCILSNAFSKSIIKQAYAVASHSCLL